MRGVRVEIRDSQRAIEYLKSRNLLNREYRVMRDGGHLLIPVLTIPPELPVDFAVVEREFPPRDKHRLSLKSYLEQHVPPGIKLPTSFDIIGDIAVIDLKEEMLPYSHHVAEGIIRSTPKIRSVYRKSSAVEGSYRTRRLELISGDGNPVTVHREHGVDIVVNVQRVYFSPRLSSEHRRVAEMVTEGERVLDMFTASGVFPLLIAKSHHAEITAVDINPVGIQCLEESMRRNRLLGTITPLCMDVRELDDSARFDRIIMNHPSAAKEFLLDADRHLESGGIVHYYSFIEAEGLHERARGELLEVCPSYEVLSVRKVRQYSPQAYHVVVDARKQE